MIQLDDLQLDTAKEIINIGLGKAADAFSFFTQGKVLISSIDLKISELSEIKQLITKEGDDVHVLITYIRGELEGVCYLIFSKEEVDKFLEISLPPSIEKGSDAYKEMARGILLEADNILTASVVTQFANLLDYKMYGDVPNLEIMHGENLYDYVTSGSADNNFILHFKAKFISTEVNFSPDFIWLLDKQFVTGVQEFAQNDESLKRLKEMTN